MRNWDFFNDTQKFSSFITAKCKSALGMESGALLDSQITASSAHDIGNVGPQHARYVVFLWRALNRKIYYTPSTGIESREKRKLCIHFSRGSIKFIARDMLLWITTYLPGRCTYIIYTFGMWVNMTTSTKSFSSHFITIQHSILCVLLYTLKKEVRGDQHVLWDKE